MSQVSIIDIEGNHPQIPTEFIANIGSAIPIANQLEILGDVVPAGTTPVYTTGSGNTITTNVQLSQAIAATDIANVGLAAFDSADFTVDANGFVSLVGSSTQSIDSINVDSNTFPGTDPVLPTVGGQITVTGNQIAAGSTPNIIRTNSLAANTYTIEIQRASAQAVSTIESNGVSHFDSAAFDVDGNGFVQLNGGGIASTSFDVQANTGPGTDPVVPTALGVVSVNGAAVANHSVVLETRSRAANAYNLEIQYATSAAATDATKSGVAHFNSTQFSVDANGFVALAGGGQAIDSVAVQAGTSPIVPTAAGLITINGSTVAAGTNPVRSNGTGANTMAMEVQISQALAATDATKIGLSNFSSSHFAVDANGFVTLAGGGQAIDSIGVDATSGGGTNPVLPTAAGLVTVNGAVIAASTTPIRTVSTAANVYQVQVQTSQALAAADATKIGLSNFDSSSFAVAATGFVTLSTTGAGKTITGDSGGALSPTANNWNILGGPGITTSGSGSTLTINSVVYTNTTATTLAVDNGYFATAAGTYPMPASAAQGELIEVVCDTTGAVVLDCPASNFIRIGTLITSSGGTVTSTQQGDSLTLRYRASTLTWHAISVVGTWVIA